MSSKERNNLLKDTTLVILLSDFKCGKCQENELKKLNTIRNKNIVNIIGITTKAKRNQVAIQRKILKLDFPIYWVNDTTFYDKLAFSYEFSENYYKELIKIIKKTNNLPDEAKQLNIN